MCRRCLAKQQGRTISSQEGRLPPPLPPPSGAAKLTNRRLILLHGPEAPKFLQGIITNNLRPESRAGFYAAFLTATGKVLNDVFIYPTLGSAWHKEANKDAEQGYLIEVDADDAANLVKHIKKHKLRSKFKLRMLDEGELDVWSSWREDERWTPHTQATTEDGTINLIDCRAPGMGQRILLPSTSSDGGQAGNHASLAEVDEAPLSAYTIRRYLRGVPEGQSEIPREDALPMNYNIDLMGGIDFRKGCYIGQELTIRTHHTGVVRRRVLPCLLYEYFEGQKMDTLDYDPSAEIAKIVVNHDADIRAMNGKKRKIGKWIASNVGNVGLGMCRLENMTDLTISAEGNKFNAETDRFVVSGHSPITEGNIDIGVKAFVPDWLRGGIREPKIQKRVE